MGTCIDIRNQDEDCRGGLNLIHFFYKFWLLLKGVLGFVFLGLLLAKCHPEDKSRTSEGNRSSPALVGKRKRGQQKLQEKPKLQE